LTAQRKWQKEMQAKSKMSSQEVITITDSMRLLLKMSIGDGMSTTSFWLSELLSISQAQVIEKEMPKMERSSTPDQHSLSH
jgi:hypothetical protein